MGQRVEQLTETRKLPLRFGVSLLQAQALQPVAGNVADAHHRRAADGAARHFESSPLEAGDLGGETLAALQQLGHPFLHPLGPGGVEPSGEREDAARIHRLGDEVELALDARFAVGAIPHDDDLGLAGQKLPGAFEIGARALQFDGEFALTLIVAPAHVGERQRAQRQNEDQRRQHDGREIGVGHVHAGRVRRRRGRPYQPCAPEPTRRRPCQALRPLLTESAAPALPRRTPPKGCESSDQGIRKACDKVVNPIGRRGGRDGLANQDMGDDCSPAPRYRRRR